MTSTVEITYLYNNFSLSINESIMNRAVRVKTAVKDKIKRVFESKENVVSSAGVVSPVVEKQSLIDLDNEKLLNLNDILNKLELQSGIIHNANRAVLFTQPLVAKIYKVTKKWFDGMPRVEKKIETPISTEMQSMNMMNHLGGEVVPGNWNYVSEKDETQEKPLSLEPTLEAVPTVNAEIPTEEVQMPSIEIPTSLGNTEVYKFNFDMEPELPIVTPVTNTSEETNSFDFVPEPKEIEVSMQKDEPAKEEMNETKLPTFENNDFGFNLPNLETTVNTEISPSIEINNSVEENNKEVELPSVNQNFDNTNQKATSEMEDKINVLLNTTFTPNPANNFVPEHVDKRPAEEKIAELLGKAAMVQETTPEVNIPTTLEEAVINQAEPERPEITQGQVLARLRRLNNAMAEKDATIKNLTAKNDTLKEEVAMSRDKIAEYEVKVSDLSTKNSELSSQNERLSAKLEEVETSSKSTIAKLELKVNELTQSKSDELESLRRQVEELKASHASEISSMREKHAAEIKLERESKEKQIQAIYSTITDALGDEDYSKGMAA